VSAADYIVKTCRQHSGEVILCPVGPLTNIAAALRADPELVNHVQKVVIMGGAVWAAGNVSDYAEANIWNDPQAADEVFAANWDIDLIGLDVTQKISCDDADFARLRKAAPDIGGFLHDISAFYIKFYHSVINQNVCLIHDPSALVAITDEPLFGFKATPLSVVCEGEAVGQTVPDGRLSRRPVRVAVSADVQKVKRRFLDICATADKMKDDRLACQA
jgi:inosine-uridine nucleoside N-ribohydrolase